MNENIRKSGLFRKFEQLKTQKSVETSAEANNALSRGSNSTIKAPVTIQQLMDLISDIVPKTHNQTDASSHIVVAQEMQAADGTVPQNTNKTPTEELAEFEARIASGEFDTIRPCGNRQPDGPL